MPSNRDNLTLDEQSFQSLLWAAFTIQEYNSQKLGDTAMAPTAQPAELLDCVPNHLLREIVQQALQSTHATGAAIALKQQGELICRAAAGDFASEIGTVINTKSGFTGVCTSTGTMQLCSNTALDSRADADACQKLGVSAIIVVPIVHQDQLLGLIAVFSRRPYAFGIRDLQALQDLAEKFAASLQLSAESATANTGHESLRAPLTSPLDN
jgi:L-methionine (R)-S-oxide reductase